MWKQWQRNPEIAARQPGSQPGGDRRCHEEPGEDLEKPGRTVKRSPPFKRALISQVLTCLLCQFPLSQNGKRKRHHQQCDHIHLGGSGVLIMTTPPGHFREAYTPFIKSRSHFFFFGGQGHPGRARGTQGKARGPPGSPGYPFPGFPLGPQALPGCLWPPKKKKLDLLLMRGGKRIGKKEKTDRKKAEKH